MFVVCGCCLLIVVSCLLCVEGWSLLIFVVVRGGLFFLCAMFVVCLLCLICGVRCLLFVGWCLIVVVC